MQAEAAASTWPPGEQLVDLAWYKAGQLAVLAAPAAAAARPPRSPPGDEAVRGGCRLLLLPWGAAQMHRIDLQRGMAPLLHTVRAASKCSDLHSHVGLALITTLVSLNGCVIDNLVDAMSCLGRALGGSPRGTPMSCACRLPLLPKGRLRCTASNLRPGMAPLMHAIRHGLAPLDGTLSCTCSPGCSACPHAVWHTSRPLGHRTALRAACLSEVLQTKHVHARSGRPQ